MRTDHVFEQFAGIHEQTENNLKTEIIPLPRNFDCLKKLMEVYESACGGRMSDYDLQYVKYFVRECETLTVPSDIDRSIERLKISCHY
jgi:hypothetical protein